ncbi:hypothetical protein D4764_16G0003730 [Takifugu flavidus]|uniref:Uncharacterized protein n=1 Tax=Takifugu flavidus TaxID=433684 RepID=A0A5C6NYC7_9TELE|nr:hypothetical protein D4764_16G0003730 [Takifugu flavidus]
MVATNVCFAADFGQFQKITGEQIQMLDELAKDVEREKKKASSETGAGLCTEYEALHKIEMEENDFINQFMQK